MGELKATFSTALEVLQCSKTITSYDRSQCVLLALFVCALGVAWRKGGFGSTKWGGGDTPPTAPKTVASLGVTHWLAAAPMCFSLCLCWRALSCVRTVVQPICTVIAAAGGGGCFALEDLGVAGAPYRNSGAGRPYSKAAGGVGRVTCSFLQPTTEPEGGMGCS